MLRALDLGQRKVKNAEGIGSGSKEGKKKLMSWDLGQRKVKKS